MTTTTLITGGTSGIGAAFAHKLASEGNALVLVARDAARLQEQSEKLAEEHGVEVETLRADLSTVEGVQLVIDRLNSDEKPIDLLVNNAGFGSKGGFLDSSPDAHAEMLRVNVEAVVRLTHAALGVMVPRKSGGIINVSSVAGFTPALRPSSTYAATKAFVTALTEGLSHTFDKSGVHVSAVCPGFVRTEFHTRAGITMSKLPKLFWLEPDFVVEKALHDHRAGKVISIPSWQYKVIVAMAQYTPRSLWHVLSKLFGSKTR